MPHICTGMSLVKQVGLGTDVAGGYSPSMLSAMRSAVLTSKAVRMMRIDAARRQPANRPGASAGRDEGPAASEQPAAAGDGNPPSLPLRAR